MTPTPSPTCDPRMISWGDVAHSVSSGVSSWTAEYSESIIGGGAQKSGFLFFLFFCFLLLEWFGCSTRLEKHCSRLSDIRPTIDTLTRDTVQVGMIDHDGQASDVFESFTKLGRGEALHTRNSRRATSWLPMATRSNTNSQRQMAAVHTCTFASITRIHQCPRRQGLTISPPKSLQRLKEWNEKQCPLNKRKELTLKYFSPAPTSAPSSACFLRQSSLCNKNGILTRSCINIQFSQPGKTNTFCKRSLQVNFPNKLTLTTQHLLPPKLLPGSEAAWRLSCA